MTIDIEVIKSDFENLYLDFEMKIEMYKIENPHAMERIKTIMTDTLHYTSDEEYFKFRRDFNDNLTKLFISYRDSLNIKDVTLYDIDRYLELLKGIETIYFEKAFIKENEIVEFAN